MLGQDRTRRDARHAGAIPALSAPLFVCVEITSRCDCDCVGCYARPRPADPDLPIGTYRHLLSELRDMNPAKVTFTGGEPGLDKPRLLESLAAMHDADSARRLGLMTNGRQFTQRDFAEMGSALSWINVNLSAAMRELDRDHEDDARLPERILSTIPALSAAMDATVDIDLSVMADARTPSRIGGLCQLAQKVAARSLSVVLLRQTDPGRPPSAPAGLKPHLVESLARWKTLYPARIVDSSTHAKRMIGTGAPNAELYVRADGAMAISPFIPRGFDESRFQPGQLQSLWDSRFSGSWRDTHAGQAVQHA